MQVGDKVKLAGRTKHGKNRVNEQGDLWTVAEITVIEHDSSFAQRGTKLALLNSDRDPLKWWRWIRVENDVNFKVKKVSE